MAERYAMVTRAERDQILLSAWQRGLTVKQAAKETGMALVTVRSFEARHGCAFIAETARAEKMAARLREALAQGVTVAAAVRELGISRRDIAVFEARSGLSLPRARRGVSADHPSVRARHAENAERIPRMEALYRAGYSLETIAADYGISRERVRQLLKKYTETTRRDGGVAVQAAVRAARVRASREAACLRRYGCTVDQMKEIRRIGGGTNRIVRTYQSQRGNAKTRGIEWRMTFWEWWTIWQQSGHWQRRGRGQGYVMCRQGDEGPYAVGNVFIATAAENSSNQRGRKSDLPMGVTATKSGRFAAHRMIGGRVRGLGTHDTPAQAHAAYLMAGSGNPAGGGGNLRDLRPDLLDKPRRQRAGVASVDPVQRQAVPIA